MDEQSHEGRPIGRQLGGVVTYGALAFLREGFRAVAVTNLGGEYERRARDVMSSLGIVVRAGSGPVMTSFRNHLFDDGRRRQELLAVAPSIDGSTLTAALPADVVHLGPLHGADIAPNLLATLSGSNLPVTLDLQGLVRASRLGAVEEALSPLFEPAMRVASIVKAAAGELAAVGRLIGLDANDLLETYAIDEIVVTHGAAGGSVLTRDVRGVEYRAVPVEHPLDTTGAGDVFFATYVAARIFGRASIDEACRRAAACAARHVSGEFIHPRDLRL